MDISDEKLADDRWSLLWAAQVSSRYHARRQAFFERWHRISSSIVAILGSTAATSAIAHGGATLTATSALIVAGFSAIDLVIGTSSQAQLHHQLRGRFLDLEAEIKTSEDTPSRKEINKWTKDRLKIESDEPPIFNVLNLLCENELSRSQGSEKRVEINKIQTFFAHWLHQPNVGPYGDKAKLN